MMDLLVLAVPAAKYTPVRDPVFWFVTVVGTTVLSALGFFLPRLLYGKRASFVQLWLYAPFLAIAVVALLMMIITGVAAHR